MRLVDIGNGTGFINMDLIMSVFKNNDNFFVIMNDSSNTKYRISEKSYNIILGYGKAKI